MRLLILASIVWGATVIGVVLFFIPHPWAKVVGYSLCSLLPLISTIEVLAANIDSKWARPVRWIYWKLEGKAWYLKRTTGGYPLLAYPLAMWIEFTGGKVFIDSGRTAFLKGANEEIERCTTSLQKAMRDAVEDAIPWSRLTFSQKKARLSRMKEEQDQYREQVQLERHVAIDKLNALVDGAHFGKNGEASFKPSNVSL